MKTLLEIKNQYAQEQGYEDWDNIWTDIGHLNDFEEVFSKYYDEICIRAQKAYYIEQITELIQDCCGLHPEYILERLQEEIEPTPKI